MKLLFLDVDGVLNDGYRGYPFLVEPCLRILKFIIDETKAHIVLSSNWRLFNEYRAILIPKLIQHGIIKNDVFSSTPDLDLDHLPLRPREILQWIRDNTTICPWQKNRDLPSVHHFAIIDDRNLINELYGHALRSQFVQTNGQVGLTMEIAKKVIKLLNHPVEITSTSTWALNYWSVFYEFENVSYVQCPIGFRVVDNRVCQERAFTPLDYFPLHIVTRIVQFLTRSEIASISITSRKFASVAGSNDVWKPIYDLLKAESHQRLPSGKYFLGNAFQQPWPVIPPVEGYYKMACCLVLASSSTPSSFVFVQKFMQCVSSRKTTDLCLRCYQNGEFISAGLAFSKYNLTSQELSSLGFSYPSQRSRKKKTGKRYCDVEIQLLALLKWGSLGAIRKRRASWQTSMEDLCTDSSRKAAKLLQSLRLKSNQG